MKSIGVEELVKNLDEKLNNLIKQGETCAKQSDELYRLMVLYFELEIILLF